jgi:hypothetical protein
MTRFFFFLLAALLPVSTALAWGPTGHRLVARLAEPELKPAARAEIARLLRGEADPTLAGVANWADELRERDPDLGRRSSRWHYVNLAEDGCAYRPAAHCRDGDCVIEAIRRQRDLLADRRQPDAVRAQALKFLVHFVGDAPAVAPAPAPAAAAGGASRRERSRRLGRGFVPDRAEGRVLSAEADDRTGLFRSLATHRRCAAADRGVSAGGAAQRRAEVSRR